MAEIRVPVTEAEAVALIEGASPDRAVLFSIGTGALLLDFAARPCDRQTAAHLLGMRGEAKKS